MLFRINAVLPVRTDVDHYDLGMCIGYSTIPQMGFHFLELREEILEVGDEGVVFEIRTHSYDDYGDPFS